MNIVVAGGTGFIGRAFIRKLLDEGHGVLALSRRTDAFKNISHADLQVASWDGETQGPWARLLGDKDAVVNLAGEGIADKRWSAERKKQILLSRVNATRALVEALGRCSDRPKVLLNASAVGFYGDVPSGEVAESHPKGQGFLADVCAEWEKEALKAEAFGTRVVLMRFGVVIGKGGGALQKFIPPFRFFAGGPLGSGRQYFPWVHLDDVIGATLYALKNNTLSGPVNVTAPESLTMSQFCRELGSAMHRPSWAPVPGFVLRALLGEMSGMILNGQNAVPRKLEQAGYRFQHPQAGPALAHLFQR